MKNNRLKSRLKKTYKKDLNNLYKFLVPSGSSVLKISNNIIPRNKKRFDYVILDNCIGDIKDVQRLFTDIKKKINPSGRIIITYYNYIWEPILKTASYLGLRVKTKEQNWLDNEDIANILNLTGYDVITTQKRFLLPLDIPLITSFINKFIAHLPLINNLCLTTFVIAKPKIYLENNYSVSIIVPAKNESGNIPNIVRCLPKFGKSQEIIFVEGNSDDDTWLKINNELNKNKKPNLTIKAFKQKGKGKADAVRLGFEKAAGEVLMIYDADMTVDGNDLSKFYNVLSLGIGEFVNGTRLVYPMEKDAMQTLNKFFNKFFSYIFTWILGQRFKDTLCGTKTLFKKDYQKIINLPSFFGHDPFGDFDLIFGAIKLNLKVIEIPVRYKKRIYGSTNISRFKNGVQLIKMIYISFKKFKAW